MAPPHLPQGIIPDDEGRATKEILLLESNLFLLRQELYAPHCGAATSNSAQCHKQMAINVIRAEPGGGGQILTALKADCCKLVENYLENNCYAAQLFLTLIMMKIVTRSFMMIKIDRNIYHKF